ncbi:MAG: hypothetical protein JXA96_14040 [Sedimentisphaerales bacterium]|nr:hypothetical protein [Sedimentisphaerales bacterium]
MKKKWILLFSVTVCILLLTLLLQDVSAGCWKKNQQDSVCDGPDHCDEKTSYWRGYRYEPTAEYCLCSSTGGTWPSCVETLNDALICKHWVKCTDASCYACDESTLYDKIYDRTCAPIEE